MTTIRLDCKLSRSKAIQLAFMHTGRMMFPSRASEDDMWEVHVPDASDSNAAHEGKRPLFTPEEVVALNIICSVEFTRADFPARIAFCMSKLDNQQRFTNGPTYNQIINLSQSFHQWVVRNVGLN